MSELGDILQRLQTKLGANNAWQSWVGASEATTARIYLHEHDENTEAPYAVIDWAYDLSLEAAFMTGDDCELKGSMLIMVADEVDPTLNDSNVANFDYLNRVTNVMKELLGDADSELPMTSIDLIGGPARTEVHRRKTDGDYMYSTWSVSVIGVSVS